MLFLSILLELTLPIFFVVNVVGPWQEFYIVAAPTKGPAFFWLPKAWCSSWKSMEQAVSCRAGGCSESRYTKDPHIASVVSTPKAANRNCFICPKRSMPAVEDPLVHKSGLLKRAVPPTGGICHQSPKKIIFIPPNARTLPSTWANY